MPTAVRLALVTSLALAAACGGAGGDRADAARAPAAAPAAATGASLTDFQLQHGIGPVTSEVALGPLDQALVTEGAALFTEKCSACHKAAEKYVGPPLGGVTARRSPAYIMNMILNPQGMYEQHPEARKLLAEYMTQMPFQSVTEPQARALLEYLRTLTAEAPAS